MIIARSLRCHVLSQKPKFCGLLRPRYSSTKSSEPLRILFCGSDEISIASLNALYAEKKRSPEKIAAIDVVCRPGKRVGRGLKTIREVPVKTAASDLGLPVHEIDTFTGWTPPQPRQGPFNLVIAVSFGLLVPPRILGAAKYGGLNIHPSLLPDFRGPAPIHHALLAGETETGITLQTLHESRFDHGLILDQTRFKIPDPESCGTRGLVNVAAEKGAEVLVRGIRNRLYVPPLQPIGSSKLSAGTAPRHAAKITPEDRHIDWSSWKWDRIQRYHRVLGSLWNIASTSTELGPSTKRIILADMEAAQPGLPMDLIPGMKPGIPFIFKDSSIEDKGRPLYIFTKDETLVRINQLKVEGDVTRGAYFAALRARAIQSLVEEESSDNHPVQAFHAPLQ